MRSRRRAHLLRLAVAVAVTAVGLPLAFSPDETAEAGPSSSGDALPVAQPTPTPEPERTPTGSPVTLAFGGDVHGEREAGRALQAGLPSIRDTLAAADLAVVNLETAITDGGTASAKQFNFRAPAAALSGLTEAGVDVVTLANNHGMDYGVEGLRDTLDSAESVGLPVVGIGADEDEAYAPYVTTVRGQRIAVIGATQVLDDSLLDAWTAGPGKPGLASAKREERLLAEVRRVRPDADTVVVYLHWGRERESCPLPRQETLAQRLVDAGADVIVGSHAHVLLGGGYLDGAYVDYGLGNFVFYTRSGPGTHSGVLTLTVQGRAVTAADWAPARIRNGAPHLLTGAAAETAREAKERLRDCTELAPAP